MFQVVIVRALYPHPNVRTLLLDLIESAGIHIRPQTGNVIEIEPKMVSVDDNYAVLDRIKSLASRSQEDKMLIVSFSLGKPEVHLHELFRTLPIFHRSMAPPIGVVFEPDWNVFQGGQWAIPAVRPIRVPGTRCCRVPYTPFGQNKPRDFLGLQLLEDQRYRPYEAEYLGWYLGLTDEEPVDEEAILRRSADDTQRLARSADDTAPFRVNEPVSSSRFQRLSEPPPDPDDPVYRQSTLPPPPPAKPENPEKD